MILFPRVLFFIALSTATQITRAQNFGGQPPSIRWRQLNTRTARVIFPPTLDSQANRILNIMRMLDTTTSYSIGGKTRKWNIVLLNQTVNSNAYVRMAPVLSEFYMTPDQNNFNEGSIRWDDNLAIHENRHMQQLSNFNTGLTKLFSFLLGQEGQLLANGIVIPNYFFEGDAVLQETLVSRQGRGRFPFFFNGFKALWLEKRRYSWMKLRSGSLKDYVPDHYPLGYQMVAYGVEKYGPDFWKKVTQDAVRFKGLFYPFNTAIRRHSGKGYTQFRRNVILHFKGSATADTVSKTALQYLTQPEHNNVADDLHPQLIGQDSILVVERSYKKLNRFCLIVNGKKKPLHTNDLVLDDYFSYSNGKAVYAAHRQDLRWANRDFSNLQLVDIKTGKQRTITRRTKYFSPALNADASELIAVHVDPNGFNFLHRLDVKTGKLISIVPNPANYFFTQTKYSARDKVITIARNPEGETALLQVNLNTGVVDNLTPFSSIIIGYPSLRNDTMYFSAMDGWADNVFAITLNDRKVFRLTQAHNGIYFPVAGNQGRVIASAFTADGYRLCEIVNPMWEPARFETFPATAPAEATPRALSGNGMHRLETVSDSLFRSGRYRKSFGLVNLHSRRPVLADPEYGYSFISDNILSTISSNLTYTYNRNEKSHAIGVNALYGGSYPIFNLGVRSDFHRSVFDPAIDSQRLIHFNSAKLQGGFTLPFRSVGGIMTKLLNLNATYNAEQLYYRGIGKNIFTNTALQYVSAAVFISNLRRQARQHVAPRFGQIINASYRYAVNYRKSKKFVVNGSMFLPGFSGNHSLVLQSSFQQRDSLMDLFSNTFSYSRGYQALSTRQMFKIGVNYQLPLIYPDLGFANIMFFQRVRSNLFYDHTKATARLNTQLVEIKNRSAGCEIFFDTKIWNALPFSFGLRYSYLLDPDLINRSRKFKIDVIIFNFIPG